MALFKKSKDDIDREYDDAYALLNSDEKQNAILPAEIKDRVLGGEACDSVDGATGPFGHCAANPIPCNGPLGAWIYLSRLRLCSTGDMLFFHQIAHLPTDVDVFEMVSTSGQFADWLYVDMYHPRKSRFSPEGYIQQFELVQPRGIMEECPDFPKDLFSLIEKECKKFLHLKAGEKRAKLINLELAGETLQAFRESHEIG